MSFRYGVGALVAFFFAANAGATVAAADLQQCAVDLCGPAADLQPSQARGVFRTAVPNDARAFIDGELGPLLSDLFEVHARGVQLRSAAMDLLLRRPGRNVLSPDLRAVLTIGALVSNYQKQMMAALEPTADGLRVDPEKFRAGTTLSPADARLRALALSAFIGQPRILNFAELRNAPFELTIAARANDLGLPSSPDRVAQTMRPYLETAARIEARIGRFAFSGSGRGAALKLAENGAASETEKYLALRFLEIVDFFAGALAPEVKEAALAVNMTIDEAVRLADARARTQRYREELGDPAKRAALKADVTAECGRLAAGALATAASPFRVREALRLTNQVKDAARAAAADYFPWALALSKARDAVDSAEFAPPAQIDEIRARLRDSLRLDAVAERRRSERVRAVIARGEDWQSFLVVSLIGSPDPSGRLMARMRAQCNPIGVGNLNDRAYLQDSKIGMSWQVALFPGRGAGVMAHEIGHFVSIAAILMPGRFSPYRQVLDCSDRLHVEVEGLPADSPAAARYEEEDWADAFAISTLRHLRATWPHAENFACLTLAASRDADAYDMPAFVSDSRYDTHSTSLMRALQVHVGLGQTAPASCVRGLETEPARRWAQQTCAR